MTTEGTVSVSINAGPIHVTGFTTTQGARQISMGPNLYLHISPDIAKQWVTVLETIATKEGNE